MNTVKTYKDKMHKTGRIWILTAAALMFAVPITTCIVYDAWPNLQSFLKGSLSVIIIFWIAGSVEALTYIPMIGTGGSYLAFVTGNISNLKLPCALNAMKAANAEPGSDEAEVLSTIAIGISSMVTSLVVALFLVLFLVTDIQSVLKMEVLKPAFDNLLPALLGGYGIMIISKHVKMSIFPLLAMLLLFAFIPSLSSALGVLVPVGIILAIVSARLFYKKGWA
ncbi:MAG: hypothetical protein PQJ46_14315 [Spirochaetales bacterium]|nr:hypothetical protein [Spirochaetales bacterium]